ncbi:MAG TPA: cytochrome b [Gammaproteobacteria bacterium]|nr:cytochrome b [Gammaproteobacteria bacterium]
MQWRNTPQRWGMIAQLLHWLIALAVFAQIALGWIMIYWRLSPTKFQLYSLHKSLGVTLLLLVVIRLLWRLGNPAPPLPAGTPSWERRTAFLTHELLYVLLIALPVSGYLINSATNFPLVVWGVLPLPNITGENKALEELAEALHLALFWLLALLLLLHIAAALRHHWLLQDDVLRRMLPARRRGH